jgi:hypothetical protein
MQALRWPRCAGAALALAAVTACGPDLLARAELDEVCGQRAPFRLLELDPHEPLARMGHAFVGERRIVSLSYWNHEAPVFGARPSDRTALWSVGRCGESPRLLGEGADLRTMTFPEVWPEVLLACNGESGEVFTLDPEGARPSNLVFELPDCRGTPTPHGVLTVEAHDEEMGALVLQAWPDDPWAGEATRRVLLDPIRIRPAPSARTFPAYREVTAFTDHEALVVTAADELVSLSLPAGAPVVEATGVRQFELSPAPDRRLIAWQDLEITNDDESLPEGAVYVRDRATGTSTYLADAALGGWPSGALRFAEFGVLGLILGESGQERLWSWPSMRSVDLPPGTWATARSPDGRLLVSGFFEGPYALFDMATASVQPLFEEDGSAFVRDDGIAVVSPGCCLGRDFRSPASLWFVSWDGEREQLARRVTFFHTALPDDRVLTTVDVGEDWLGSMIVVEPQTLDEHVIDDHVLWGWPSLDDEGEVVYAVQDRDRTGVWLTRPAR